MIGAGILTDHENRISLLEILKQNRAFANANRLLQSNTTGLVAHIGTVREIVGAIGAHKKLIQKCRLIGGATRCIEFDTIRRIKTLQNPADGRKGFVPFDRFIFIGCRVVTHRMCKTTSVLQRIIRPGLQLGNRMFSEKLWRRASFGCLPGNSLHAIFAKLERRTMFRITPGTAGAVETIGLIGFQKSTRASQWRTAGQQLLATTFQSAPSASGT